MRHPQPGWAEQDADEITKLAQDLAGSGEEKVEFAYKDGVRSYSVSKPFEGVLRNLQRLRDADIRFGAIVVLARNTLPRIREIYRFYDSLGIPVRLLPFQFSRRMLVWNGEVETDVPSVRGLLGGEQPVRLRQEERARGERAVRCPGVQGDG